MVNLMQENDVPIYEEKKDPAQSEYDWEIELRDKVRPHAPRGVRYRVYVCVVCDLSAYLC